MTPPRRYPELFDGTLSDRAYHWFETLILGVHPRTKDPGRTRTGPAIFGFSRLLQACAFLSIAHTLTTLKTNGVLIYLGGLLGTDLLAVFCLTAAWFLFVGAAIIFIPEALVRVKESRLRTAASAALWTLTATGLAAFAFYGTWLTITANTTYLVLDSPDGTHELLIVDSSFLLLGRHHVYEPACGPLWNRRAGIATDDGYDPFREGQFSVDWSDDAPSISYVEDYMEPTARKSVTVPLSTGEACE